MAFEQSSDDSQILYTAVDTGHCQPANHTSCRCIRSHAIEFRKAFNLICKMLLECSTRRHTHVWAWRRLVFEQTWTIKVQHAEQRADKCQRQLEAAHSGTDDGLEASRDHEAVRQRHDGSLCPNCLTWIYLTWKLFITQSVYKLYLNVMYNFSTLNKNIILITHTKKNSHFIYIYFKSSKLQSP